MALNARQRFFYGYTVSIYRLTDPPVNPLHDTDVPVMTDYGVYSLVASGVKAQFIASPSNTAPSEMGRTNQDIIFTLDKWHFENSVVVEDADAILVTAVRGTSPMVGRVWTVQGNGETHDTLLQTNYQMIYAKLIDNRLPGVNA